MKKVYSILICIFSVVISKAQIISINIGDQAPELNFWNQDSTKQIALSSLRGKIVLVDFWASWCPACRVESPHLVHTYNTYKNKQFGYANGFEIYSVSLDDTRSDWVAAIIQDSLYWPSHVSDLAGWNSLAAQTYSVNSIPNNFLLDGNGRIITKNFPAWSGKLDSLLYALSYNPAAGMVKIDESESIAIYPNPANSYIKVSSSSQSINEIKIIDVLSKEVLYKENSQTEIDVSNLASGVYFLQTKTQNNIAIKKVVIQH